MKTLAVLGILTVLGTALVRGEPLVPAEPQPFAPDLLARVRNAAMTIPGEQYGRWLNKLRTR